MAELSAGDLEDLSLQLSAVEDWVRECGGRHADAMADIIHEAWHLVDDLADAAAVKEAVNG